MGNKKRLANTESPEKEELDLPVKRKATQMHIPGNGPRQTKHSALPSTALIGTSVPTFSPFINDSNNRSEIV